MKIKKIPMRKCVACNNNIPKKELLRIVNNKDEGVTVDLTGKKNGRGAYICRKKECFDKAIKNKNLEYALNVEINEEIYKEILNYVMDSE